MSLCIDAFHDREYTTISDVFRCGLNENYWRHAITFSQGNGWSVTLASVKDRLKYLRARLLRKMFGNHWRGKAEVDFLGFKHGSKNSFDEHYHALMGIRGVHDWSDEHIKDTLYDIDALRPCQELRQANSYRLRLEGRQSNALLH